MKGDFQVDRFGGMPVDYEECQRIGFLVMDAGDVDIRNVVGDLRIVARRSDAELKSLAASLAGARSQKARDEAVDAALQKVGLSLAEVKGRFPHELSGGQLQRTAIARALISSPALIVADEPVSMVEASLRMSIVNLFTRLHDELKASILYITHDLATAYYISDRVMIMQKAKVVETGPAREVLIHPRHPYSILLKESVLSPDNVGRGRLTLDREGEASGLKRM